jgi:putative sigma-54 modulation protein
MRINIKAKAGVVPDQLRDNVDRKTKKLERLFHRVQDAEIVYAVEHGMHVIELSLDGDGTSLRCEERRGDLAAALDNAVEKMERQIKRYKTRVRDGHRRASTDKGFVAELPPGVEEEETDEDASVPRIVRRKRFPIKPMPLDEAITQIELSDHDFYLFLNDDTGEFNVLYRRRDGDYGVIEAEA